MSEENKERLSAEQPAAAAESAEKKATAQKGHSRKKKKKQAKRAMSTNSAANESGAEKEPNPPQTEKAITPEHGKEVQQGNAQTEGATADAPASDDAEIADAAAVAVTASSEKVKQAQEAAVTVAEKADEAETKPAHEAAASEAAKPAGAETKPPQKATAGKSQRATRARGKKAKEAAVTEAVKAAEAAAKPTQEAAVPEAEKPAEPEATLSQEATAAKPQKATRARGKRAKKAAVTKTLHATDAEAKPAQETTPAEPPKAQESTPAEPPKSAEPEATSSQKSAPAEPQKAAELEAKKAESSPAGPPKKGSATSFFAKKQVRIALAALCVLLVCGGIGWWAYATTPGWHYGEKKSYYIMEGTHSRAKGFYTIENTEYAFDDHGILMHGFGQFDGKTYYADENGQRLYGDIEIDGVSHHLDESSGEYRTGLYSTADGSIGFSETGFPFYATVGRVEGEPYYFDEKGLMQATDGLYQTDGKQGDTYFPLATGVLQTGWQTIADKRYYFDPDSCAMHTGVTEVGKTRYLLGDDGALCTGIAATHGDTYLANADGVVLTGWQTPHDAPAESASEGVSVATSEAADEGATYYLDPETGKMSFGHRKIDEATYFFDTQSGAMVCSGLGRDDSGAYWLGADGKALTGWQQIGKRRFYFGEDYCAVTGYQTLDGNRYFFTDKGSLQTGFQTIDGTLCYFGEDGVIKAGAYEYHGTSLLFDEDGQVLSGWHELAGVNYYYVQGVKQTGEVTIDGEDFYLGSDGIMRTGWIGDYYYSSHGYPYHGAQKVDGVLHYFDSTGKMLRNTTVGSYEIDANGVAKKMAVPVGGSVSSCYNFVRGYMHYASVPAASYNEMVQYALANHRGSCYHYAALLNYVLAQSGIGSNIVWGTNPQGGTHVWCTLANGNILDACDGRYNVTPAQMAAWGFSW